MAETSLCFVTPRVNAFVEKKNTIQQPQRGETFVEGSIIYTSPYKVFILSNISVASVMLRTDLM